MANSDVQHEAWSAIMNKIIEEAPKAKSAAELAHLAEAFALVAEHGEPDTNGAPARKGVARVTVPRGRR